MTCDRPHNIGPANKLPNAMREISMKVNCVVPDAMEPHTKAMDGGNHVTGFISAIDLPNISLSDGVVPTLEGR